ncbi:MAG TPA: sugar ABC transporter permease [bacterium]|nr:sugar ABC transporter permease [bacterium]
MGSLRTERLPANADVRAGGKAGRPSAAWAFVAPLIVLFVSLTTFPFLYMIYMSFRRYNLAAWTPSRWVGLDNYVTLFARDPTVGRAVTFTAWFVVIALPVEMVFGVAVALLIRNVVGERAWRAAVLLPMMIPAVVAGVAWKMLYNFEFGPVNYALSFVHVAPVSWLGDFTMAPAGIILIDIWQWTPFVFLVVYAALQSVSRDLVEAARVDGAGPWQTVWWVELPLIRTVLWIILIIRLIDMLKLFDIIYMTTFGGPGDATTSLSFYIYKVGVSFGWDVGYASALSVVLLAAITILTNVLIKTLNLRELLGL